MDWEPYVGRKVVCINERWPSHGLIVVPVVGQICTVREIYGGVGPQAGMLGLRFYEIVNPVARYPDGLLEPSFNSAQFRPLLERETDISCLEALLRLTPEDIAVVGVEDVVLDIADAIAHK